MPKVLSIRQPWASMIARGLKRFEIRSWSTTYRGQLLIHASGAAPTRAYAEEVFEYYPELMARIGLHTLDDLKALPRSAIVGTVTIADVLDSKTIQGVATVDDASVIGDLDDDSFYWRLRDAIEIDPVTGIDGKLNLWTLPPAKEKLVVARIPKGTPAAFKSKRAGAARAEWKQGTDEDDDDTSPTDNRLLVPSSELAAIIGKRPIKLDNVMKRVWAYIVKHGLQDASNKHTIHADDKLKKVTGRAKIDIFKIAEKVSRHLREA